MRLDTFYEITGTKQVAAPIVDQSRAGRGMRAGMDLPVHTILCPVCGPHASYMDAITAKNNKDGLYCLQIGPDEYISPSYPFFKFRHSCEPNCGINDHYQLVTIRDVRRDEELSWDYSTFMTSPTNSMVCACGAGSCRNRISGFNELPLSLKKFYLEKNIVPGYIREQFGEKAK